MSNKSIQTKRPLTRGQSRERAESVFNRLTPSNRGDLSVENIQTILAEYDHVDNSAPTKRPRTETSEAEGEDYELSAEKQHQVMESLSRDAMAQYLLDTNYFDFPSDEEDDPVVQKKPVVLEDETQEVTEQPQSTKENSVEGTAVEEKDETETKTLGDDAWGCFKPRSVAALTLHQTRELKPPRNLVVSHGNLPTDTKVFDKFSLQDKCSRDAFVASVLFNTNRNLELLGANMDHDQETMMTAEQRTNFDMKTVDTPLSGTDLAKDIRTICGLEDRFHQRLAATTPNKKQVWPIGAVWKEFTRICHSDCVVLGSWVARRTQMIQDLYGIDLATKATTARVSLKAKAFPTMSLFLRTWCMLWALSDNELYVQPLLEEVGECVNSKIDFWPLVGAAFQSDAWVTTLDRTMKTKWCPAQQSSSTQQKATTSTPTSTPKSAPMAKMDIDALTAEEVEVVVNTVETGSRQLDPQVIVANRKYGLTIQQARYNWHRGRTCALCPLKGHDMNNCPKREELLAKQGNKEARKLSQQHTGRANSEAQNTSTTPAGKE